METLCLNTRTSFQISKPASLSLYRSFATGVSQLKIWHFFVIGIERNNFEVRHPRCVSNKSNYSVYAYIVKHNYVLGGMLFTICKAHLHVSAINFSHLQVVVVLYI
jgi:hypothetical protein